MYVYTYKNIVFIFSGSQPHLMNEMFANPSNPFYRSTVFLQLEKIKFESYQEFIIQKFTEFKKEYPILDYSLIGSILTKRYRDDADLDINVLFDVPKEKQEEENVGRRWTLRNNAENLTIYQCCYLLLFVYLLLFIFQQLVEHPIISGLIW